MCPAHASGTKNEGVPLPTNFWPCGNVNHWRWIDAGRWPNPTASSVDASVRDDEDADDIKEDDDDIHAHDVLAAAVDFDEWGTEIDDTTGIHLDDDDQG